MMFVVIGVVIIAFFFLSHPKSPSVFHSSDNQNVTPTDMLVLETQRSMEYFISDIYPLFPEISSQVSSENITRVVPFTLKNDQLEDSRAWLLEVKAEQGINDYYVLSSLTQTKLDSPATGAGGDIAECSLEDVVFVGNERGLGRKLKETEGYIILGSQHCLTYGSGDSVSVFSINTGKKIPFKGTFKIPNTSNYQGVTALGNAQGRLRGVFGVNNPVVVVEYGNFGSAANSVEELSLVAYFDLQSGALQQVIRFK